MSLGAFADAGEWHVTGLSIQDQAGHNAFFNPNNSITARRSFLSLRISDRRQEVLIEVADSGTGIEPENAKRIFEAFFTTKSEGMGMGLSICRTIVESHGGRIIVTEGAPYGSVFQVILPGKRK